MDFKEIKAIAVADRQTEWEKKKLEQRRDRSANLRSRIAAKGNAVDQEFTPTFHGMTIESTRGTGLTDHVPQMYGEDKDGRRFRVYAHYDKENLDPANPHHVTMTFWDADKGMNELVFSEDTVTVDGIDWFDLEGSESEHEINQKMLEDMIDTILSPDSDIRWYGVEERV